MPRLITHIPYQRLAHAADILAALAVRHGLPATFFVQIQGAKPSDNFASGVITSGNEWLISTNLSNTTDETTRANIKIAQATLRCQGFTGHAAVSIFGAPTATDYPAEGNVALAIAMLHIVFNRASGYVNTSGDICLESLYPDEMANAITGSANGRRESVGSERFVTIPGNRVSLKFVITKRKP